MDQRYEDYGEHQFEALVVQMCRGLFGPGVQPFAKGPDGGKDARFFGTAANFPSPGSGWAGTTIIQAKHTNEVMAHYSDAKFSGSSATAVLTEEKVRVRGLVDRGEIDHYFLVANRRLGGLSEEAVRADIKNQCNVPGDVFVGGVEYLDLYVRNDPTILSIPELRYMSRPMAVDSTVLAECILAFAKTIDGGVSGFTAPVARTSYVEKNRINGVSPNYARRMSGYIAETRRIGDFLASPENLEVMSQYEAATEEFSFKIIEKRDEFGTFESILNYLYDYLLARDPVLRSHRKLTRAMLFYMYWHCDIGERNGADVN